MGNLYRKKTMYISKLNLKCLKIRQMDPYDFLRIYKVSLTTPMTRFVLNMSNLLMKGY